ncbi:Shedu immune nuclease family protein [Priestia megaterium]|uniref:Shedu immune nuclease family protein n=1 Tax=Priestia megaterium TaxID=1404 RepID=UPI003D052828
MKKFKVIPFDLKQVEVELKLFKVLLDSKVELAERTDILSFFKKNRHLAAFMGELDSNIIKTGRYALEFPILGNFKPDLVVGDYTRNNYLFIEFEDAKEKSIFQPKGRKNTLEWGTRLENGYSQIVDWFHILDDTRQTHTIQTTFGGRIGKYNGLLVIGRDTFLDSTLKERLDWRSDKVMINTKAITCITYDELYYVLIDKLNRYQ